MGVSYVLAYTLSAFSAIKLVVTHEELHALSKPIEYYDNESGESTYTTILHIDITSRGAWKIADEYGFSGYQREVPDGK